MIMMGMIVGSIVGGYIPTFFGIDSFSLIPVFTSAIGALIGIWLVFKFLN